MNARDADEGTSAFADTVGTKLMDDKVTIRLRTDDEVLPAQSFGDSGLAVEPVTWVERGVVKRLYHSRYWASVSDTSPDASRWPMFIDGDDLDVDDLVAQCDRGLLVKNMWYIRFVDRRSLILTGMTRDGVFLVEDGRVVRPVKNLRWNESPITFLQNVKALSRAERVGGWGYTKLPGILSTDFTFTSTTDSI
jgi:predicted Zn-dependent protease